ncbi:hypothetical protein F2P81_019598 [Scophthalmus maximus]|uniref:Uncharacterized protein n=1 Tax=Scophthalmus maximus TaxID=52904 RepID=A0A6A4SBP2_SCOMX|nr:hypothetical protein F2P81_019598 [Scophthalmus maximus]
MQEKGCARVRLRGRELAPTFSEAVGPKIDWMAEQTTTRGRRLEENLVVPSQRTDRFLEALLRLQVRESEGQRREEYNVCSDDTAFQCSSHRQPFTVIQKSTRTLPSRLDTMLTNQVLLLLLMLSVLWPSSALPFAPGNIGKLFGMAESDGRILQRSKRGWMWNQFFLLEEYTGNDHQYVGKFNSWVLDVEAECDGDRETWIEVKEKDHNWRGKGERRRRTIDNQGIESKLRSCTNLPKEKRPLEMYFNSIHTAVNCNSGNTLIGNKRGHDL